MLVNGIDTALSLKAEKWKKVQKARGKHYTV